MPDLGLSELTDDQLMELFLEAMAEFGNRDQVVRDLTQKKIFEESEKIEIRRSAVLYAVEMARSGYIDGIRKESEEFISRLVKSGQWNPLTTTEEGRAVADIDREIRNRMVAEAHKALSMPDKVNLWLHIQSGCVKASYMTQSGQRQTQSVGNVSDLKIERLVRELKECLGV